jgi:hypothetical protein
MGQFSISRKTVINKERGGRTEAAETRLPTLDVLDAN